LNNCAVGIFRVSGLPDRLTELDLAPFPDFAARIPNRSQQSTPQETSNMDQSNRYADLSLKEEDLIKGDRHVLVAYHMQPATGYGYLATAAHIAAESSTGTNVEVCTTDDFTKGVDALVYFIDEARGVMKVAYPIDLFDRNITDGRAMLVSFLTLAIGNNQGQGDVKCLKMHDFYVPRQLHRRHHHQAETRLAPGTVCQGGLPVLAGWRLHQER
jgi:hypothetical protein